jgi:penicillin-binding protein 2
MWSRFLLLPALGAALCGQNGFAGSVSDDLAEALRGTRASAVVLDIQTASVLGAFGASRRGTPGSTLKPILLEYALRHGIVTPQTEVFCRRNLRIEARSLACTHPADENAFTAENALAESCNSYFAELARRFSSTQLGDALRTAGIPYEPLHRASEEDRELTVLGLQGTAVSPFELARAYRGMMLSLPADGPVVRGLAESVSYGMADGASVPGMAILGKTGTASDPGRSWTHGWFAGVLPGRLVVVVFVPRGDGGTAAELARRFFVALRRDGAAR